MDHHLIHVEGIRCSSCIRKLEKLPLLHSEIQSAQVYFGQSLLEVKCSSPVDGGVLISLIQKIGFRAEILQNKFQLFEANRKTNRRSLSRIAVAGFCAGNIMMFSFGIYSGAENFFRSAFAYFSFALFLPVVFYSAVEFYRGSWQALKSKILSIDLPIAVALFAGFLFSAWNLIQGEYDHIYFDSAASFIFLILSARYLLARLQQNFVATYSETDFGLLENVEMAEIGSTKKREDLQVGDLFVLKKGQTLPVDAALENGDAEWNMTLVSGESHSRLFSSGMEIHSGGILISEKCEMRVRKTYHQSTLFLLQEKLETLKASKSPYIHYTDRFSHYFILIVFSIAVIFILLNLEKDLNLTLQRALALIIVACPCALALGTPLAYLLGVYRAKEKGILIFKKDIFDRMLEIKNIFFDKTGTLTHGMLQIKKITSKEPEHLNLLLNLEAASNHPISFALRKKYSSLYTPLNLAVVETPGVGVSAQWNGKRYKFVQNSESSETTSTLFENEKILLSVVFEDALHENSEKEIQKLQKVFNGLHLLTGDNITEAKRIAMICGIQSVHAEKNPEMKKEILSKFHPALMVGDGINDALAIQSAHVGIAVQGSVQLSADSSDAYFLKSGIGQVRELLVLSKKVRWTIHSNLLLSLIYNISAGTLALMGFVSPLVAALLMPLSSVIILLNTYRGVR